MATSPFTSGPDNISFDGPASDTINAGGGNDVVSSGGGGDLINGGAGDDILRGESGNDVINGGAGRDIISGGLGDDRLGGGEGNDILNGGAGKDTLNGGTGNDDLTGGEGVDTLEGGSGRDKFNFQASDGASSKDLIIDFENGIDKMVLKGDMSLAGIADQNGGTLITFDTGATVFLKGVAASDIDATDFLFQGGADNGGLFI